MGAGLLGYGGAGVRASGKESCWLSAGVDGDRPAEPSSSEGRPWWAGVWEGEGFPGEGERAPSEVGVAGVRLQTGVREKTKMIHFG